MRGVLKGFKGPMLDRIHFSNVHQCSILSLSFPEMRRIASLCFLGFHISEGVPENVLELGLCIGTKGTNTTPRLVTTWAGYHPKSFYMMQVFTLGQEGSPTPGGGVQVSWGVIHNWGSNREGDWQTDWSTICSDAHTEPIRRCEEGTESLDLPVSLPPCSHLWSGALSRDRKNKVVNTIGRNKLPSQG